MENSFYSYERETDAGKITRLEFGDKRCEIAPFESPMTPDLSPQYVKIPLSASNQSRMSALGQQIPSLMAADALSGAYYVIKWPDGLPHELMESADKTGFRGMVKKENGQIGGHALFQTMEPQAVILAGFAVMSIVTSQYFLTEINHKLSKISLGIDKIMEFLHGNKKSELLSEIQFVKYAHDNYASIMEHSEQRIATIQSLQGARKTAVQDMEFYLNELHSNIQNGKSDAERTVRDALQMREWLDLSVQLYVTENLLEVYYSQNYDPSYLDYVEESAGKYIDRYEKQLIGDFNALKVLLPKTGKIGKKPVSAHSLEQVDGVITRLMDGEGKELKRKLKEGLRSAEQAAEYCISTDGTIYLKKST